MLPGLDDKIITAWNGMMLAALLLPWHRGAAHFDWSNPLQLAGAALTLLGVLFGKVLNGQLAAEANVLGGKAAAAGAPHLSLLARHWSMP